MYRQIKQAQSKYNTSISAFNDQNAKLYFASDFIMSELISSGVLQHTESVNPIDEIHLASRTIKTGPNGVPNRRAFKIEHRNIHPSQYGIMSAATTPESGTVGLIIPHTLTPVIVNEQGSYGIKDIDTMSTWGTLSVNESLVPFQNQMD